MNKLSCWNLNKLNTGGTHTMLRVNSRRQVHTLVVLTLFTLFVGLVSGTGPASAGSGDRLNNVETVWLADNAPAGSWTVTVRGFNVPEGPQPFALVVSGSDLEYVLPPAGETVFLPLVLR